MRPPLGSNPYSSGEPAEPAEMDEATRLALNRIAAQVAACLACLVPQAVSGGRQ